MREREREGEREIESREREKENVAWLCVVEKMRGNQVAGPQILIFCAGNVAVYCSVLTRDINYTLFSIELIVFFI